MIPLLPRLDPMRPYPRLPKAENKIEQLRQFYAATATEGFERVLVTRADGRKDQIYSVARAPAGLDDVYLTDRFAHHVVIDHPGQHREQFANLVLPTLQDPFEVRPQQVDLGGGKIERRLIYLVDFLDKKAVIIVRDDPRHGALGWSFIPLNEFRERHLAEKPIYRRGRG